MPDEINEIKVNDGGGLLNSIGLIDSLIMDCNDSVKTLVGGNYIAFCNKMCDMVRKLDLLKNGVKDDIKSRDLCIKELRQMLNGVEENAP